ncbi:MAG: hypothetical protein ACOC1I_01550 [Spirochaetota bacterium]
MTLKTPPSRRARGASALLRIGLVTTASALLAFVVACTGSAPEILYPDVSLSLSRDPETGSVAEVMRLYTAIRDPDGADDPARIYLVHDESELYWEFAREEWAHIEYAGDHWFGMPDIRMPDGRDLPRGAYRLIAEDAGLARTQTELFVTRESPDRGRRFPNLVMTGDTMRVDYDTRVILRVYNRAGQMLVNTIVGPGEVPDEVTAELAEETGLVAYVSTLDDRDRLESGPFGVPVTR